MFGPAIQHTRHVICVWHRTIVKHCLHAFPGRGRPGCGCRDYLDKSLWMLWIGAERWEAHPVTITLHPLKHHAQTWLKDQYQFAELCINRVFYMLNVHICINQSVISFGVIRILAWSSICHWEVGKTNKSPLKFIFILPAANYGTAGTKISHLLD